MSHVPLIIGFRYTPEQIFSMAQRGARKGVEALSQAGRISPNTARAFFVVALIKDVLKHSDVEKTKNLLGALGDVVEATRNENDKQLTERVMNALNKATMDLGDGR